MIDGIAVVVLSKARTYTYVAYVWRMMSRQCTEDVNRNVGGEREDKNNKFVFLQTEQDVLKDGGAWFPALIFISSAPPLPRANCEIETKTRWKERHEKWLSYAQCCRIKTVIYFIVAFQCICHNFPYDTTRFGCAQVCAERFWLSINVSVACHLNGKSSNTHHHRRRRCHYPLSTATQWFMVFSEIAAKRRAKRSSRFHNNYIRFIELFYDRQYGSQPKPFQ